MNTFSIWKESSLKWDLNDIVILNGISKKGFFSVMTTKSIWSCLIDESFKKFIFFIEKKKIIALRYKFIADFVEKEIKLFFVSLT